MAASPHEQNLGVVHPLRRRGLVAVLGLLVVWGLLWASPGRAQTADEPPGSPPPAVTPQPATAPLEPAEPAAATVPVDEPAAEPLPEPDPAPAATSTKRSKPNPAPPPPSPPEPATSQEPSDDEAVESESDSGPSPKAKAKAKAKAKQQAARKVRPKDPRPTASGTPATVGALERARGAVRDAGQADAASASSPREAIAVDQPSDRAAAPLLLVPERASGSASGSSSLLIAIGVALTLAVVATLGGMIVGVVRFVRGSWNP